MTKIRDILRLPSKFSNITKIEIDKLIGETFIIRRICITTPPDQKNRMASVVIKHKNKDYTFSCMGILANQMCKITAYYFQVCDEGEIYRIDKHDQITCTLKKVLSNSSIS